MSITELVLGSLVEFTAFYQKIKTNPRLNTLTIFYVFMMLIYFFQNLDLNYYIISSLIYFSIVFLIFHKDKEPIFLSIINQLKSDVSHKDIYPLCFERKLTWQQLTNLKYEYNQYVIIFSKNSPIQVFLNNSEIRNYHCFNLYTLCLGRIFSGYFKNDRGEIYTCNIYIRGWFRPRLRCEIKKVEPLNKL